jgi:hypothetical protein
MSVTQSHLSHEIHIRRGIEREDDEDRTWPERRGQGKVPISLRGMHGMSYPIPPLFHHPTRNAWRPTLTSPGSRALKFIIMGGHS